MYENTEGAINRDNPEKLATYGTQDTRQINVREYRRGNKKDNPEKLATKGTHDEEKHNKNTTKYVLATSTD
jgi:hypothetical protein